MEKYIDHIQSHLKSSLNTMEVDKLQILKYQVPSVEISECSSQTIEDPAVGLTFIEFSNNSCRISMKFKNPKDSCDKFLVKYLCSNIMKRADEYQIIRKTPLEGFDLSFLILSGHLKQYGKNNLLEFLQEFLQNLYKQINHVRMHSNSISRWISSNYWHSF